MTHDPRLPALEQIMNGSPYELVDSPFSKDKMEAWRAQSIATGASGALAAFHQLYEMVRNDAAEAATRADEAKARETLVAHLCDQVSLMQDRINRLADQLEAKQRADDAKAREQRRLDEEEITLPPDIAAKAAQEHPAKIGDDTHHPGGELHSVDPKEEDPEYDEPPEDRDDDQGNLPPELTKDVPPAPSTYGPDFEQPKAPVVSQPTAISLNTE
jgi:hypothetical protein